jgi:glycine/sarcosine N-methyltransferase
LNVGGDAGGGGDDRYARTEYRRLIAWESRIRREAPLFERLLSAAPERSVVDIGCGTGEHAAWFAQHGVRAVGVDSSASMLEKAREHEARGHGRFVAGDALDLGAALGSEPPFGLAICLGNMLPHVLEEEELRQFLGGVRGALLPGGALLLQILNYERILEGGVRSLPVNFAPGDHEGEEIVLIRLLRPHSPTRIHFFPTTLTLDDTTDPPVVVRNSRRVELRPWRAAEVGGALEALGFRVELMGDVEGGRYVPSTSNDVVIVARRG